MEARTVDFQPEYFPCQYADGFGKRFCFRPLGGRGEAVSKDFPDAGRRNFLNDDRRVGGDNGDTVRLVSRSDKARTNAERRGGWRCASGSSMRTRLRSSTSSTNFVVERSTILWPELRFCIEISPC